MAAEDAMNSSAEGEGRGNGDKATFPRVRALCNLPKKKIPKTFRADFVIGGDLCGAVREEPGETGRVKGGRREPNKMLHVENHVGRGRKWGALRRCQRGHERETAQERRAQKPRGRLRRSRTEESRVGNEEEERRGERSDR